jgi:molecular chaperone DnaK (HSP70)
MTSKTTTTTTNTTPPGIWVGIDLGTSNCACAVWDSTRGGSKWLRLPGIAPLEAASGKLGRVVPSVLCLKAGYDDNKTLLENADAYHVGAQALQQDQDDATATTTLIQSVKRLLGKKWKELDPEFVESLPLELVPDEDDSGDFQIRVIVGNNNQQMLVTPVECAAMLLQSIRLAADVYLHKFTKKKYLDIPGAGQIQHVVVGIPAHFSKAQQQLVEQAAKMAGFVTVSTLMESTAAAMAYGLSFTNTNHKNHNNNNDADGDSGNEQPQTIMVVDMGGGTTDVTIATRSQEAYQVVVTEGDARLGGDDMDSAILEFVLEQQVKSKSQPPPFLLSIFQRRHLLSACKAAKEALCDPETKSDHSHIITYTYSTVQADNHKETTTTTTTTTQVTMTQHDLEQILAPWIERAKTLVQTALDRLLQTNADSNTDTNPSSSSSSVVTEVVLVGGTTRVPAIRQMLQSLFPSVELCTSLHPMASVAQGLAIHAALKSQLVPKHALQSALMLDSTPHAIGVDVGDGVFCQVIPRNTKLPAMGHATFTLATDTQPGVSIAAVERIDENNTNHHHHNDDDSQPQVTLEPLGNFTFLLRRLPPNELEMLPDNKRTIEVGMQVNPDGKFIVSIFDDQDPEQVRKKERWQQQQRLTKNQEAPVLGYLADLVMAESGVSSDQFFLVAACLGLFVMYIGVKIAFADMPLEESTQIF